MSIVEIQKRIYQNKVDKGFNVTDINKEFCLLYGEIAEAYEAYRKKDEGLGSELADIAIYLLGISEILGIDLESEIERKWYIINAEDKVLGRVATEAARLLRGKHKPTYTPNIDVGDHVIITNCAKVVLTGKKLDQKIYRHHSGYIGGMKEISARDLLNKNPEKMMMLAVKGMLPHNSLGRQMAKKLRVYAGAEHENMAQKPEVWNF